MQASTTCRPSKPAAWKIPTRRDGRAGAQSHENSGTTTEGLTLEEIRRRTADLLRSLPPERFPNIIAMVPAMLGMSDDDQFEYGLARLLDGLELTRSGRGPGR